MNPCASQGDAICLTGVGKRYRRPTDRATATTLKSLLTRDVWRAFARRSPTAIDAAHERAGIWALRHVTLQVPRGRVTGIVGHNGSGKSTLLKLLGHILTPDEGEVRVQGRVAALIELGAGFHPELTGRENIYINGIILGLSKAEVRGKMDQIVAFAELGDFIDYPVRTYSSGMYARLGFAVAIHVEPDILLVDEVLSVGDATFTARCRQALESFRDAGKSIVVVSHDLSTIGSFCDHAVWMEAGQLRAQGPAADIAQAYQAAANATMAGHA